MTQTRIMSLIETLASIAIGFAVSVIITAIVMPAYGHAVTLQDNIEITAIFTVLSLVRGYAVRRVFNWWGQR
jgi:hypothetical protein